MKRLVLAAVGAILVVLGVGSLPVRAHTELDYSLPADGSVVGEPIDEITVAFTDPVTLVGNGFQVLDPQGQVVLPTPITDDDVVFRLILDAPLAGGDVGVIYEVTAADGHVVSGGFSFLVDTPPLTTAPPTTVPATVAPTTATPEPTAAPSTAGVTATSGAPSSTDTSATSTSVAGADDDGDGNTGLIIAGAVGVAIVAAAFVLLRGRPAG